MSTPNFSERAESEATDRRWEAANRAYAADGASSPQEAEAWAATLGDGLESEGREHLVRDSR